MEQPSSKLKIHFLKGALSVLKQFLVKNDEWILFHVKISYRSQGIYLHFCLDLLLMQKKRFD